MPKVEVWVDDICEPCRECERREEKDEGVLVEILREWHFAKSRGDYEIFEQFLVAQGRGAWREVVYGPHNFSNGIRKRSVK